MNIQRARKEKELNMGNDEIFEIITSSSPKIYTKMKSKVLTIE